MRSSHRTFVSYIDKSREYYAAHGYATPYRWASNVDAPFTPLSKPLAECRVAVVTTAALVDGAVNEPFIAPADPAPAAMQTTHLSWHKEATHMDDLGAFLPLDHLRTLAAEGLIGEASPRFVGVPTLYSQRRTERNAELARQWLAEDEVDFALLVPL